MNVEAELDRIVKFIQKLVQDSRTAGIVVGVSGGIDSATTAALCVRAIGKEKVFALLMPIHSSEDDLKDAKLVASHLGIKFKTINLTESFDIFFTALSQDLDADPLAKANLKPRMRMCTLYFYSNQMNYLVAGTGNKSEDDVGYFTKYGDGGVDFLPIRHLYKHEVRELARFLKIPEKIVTRKPSAGLWEGQTDEDELSSQLGFPVTYDLLDEMLENIEKDNYDKNDEKYKKLTELKRRNHHKLELPPALNRTFSPEIE
ncbi:MAG: NAD+ synthase [Candidatus Helarchaeota archaeon]|nr:NAD+ synthase [Candidatus Helarchaeota archaeon]